MWGGMPGAPARPGGGYGQAMGQPQQQQQQQQQQQKHDIFVGNLAFNTTEEQLHQAFSEIGRVIKVRLVTDQETGKPRGFAFVEFEDPQAALSAIRNMNDYDLNGRRIRVNFSNSSHLEALAGKLGMDLSQQTQRGGQSSTNNNNNSSNSNSHHQNSNQSSAGAGTNAVSDALKAMSKGEMYDVMAKFKEIADRDPDEARRLLSSHPQLPEAMLFLMSKLDMVQTSVASEGGSAVLPPVPVAAGRAADPRARAMDPRAAAAAAAVAVSVPRSAPPAVAVAVAAPPPPRADPRADPRARVDPRARGGAPPPMMMPPPQPYGAPPPPQPGLLPPPPPPAATGVPNIDPALIQQVMSLTPQMIAQLPPHKQQSILALRQQIQGGR